ncbi:MAG: hypothetical protein AAF074_21520 [Pseudomonadota bacterium]
MLYVSLVGTVQIRDESGQMYTPSGRKTRGLVALLMFSKDFRRSRSWIQDKLWSDRGADQGAASLRQALTDLRRALGSYRDALITESGCIQLDPQQIRIADQAEALEAGEVLCEDLDGIVDPEFENWLRDLRHQRAVPLPARETGGWQPQRRRPPLLVIGIQAEAGVEGSAVFQLLRDDVVRSVLEFNDVRILDLGAKAAQPALEPGPGIFLRIAGSTLGDTLCVSLRIETLSGNWIVWQSPNTFLSHALGDVDAWKLRSVAQACVTRIHDEFERQVGSQGAGDFALALANRAIRQLFTFRRQDLVDADRLLKSAYETDPRGVYLSWRAFIRNTAIFEHLTDDFLEPCEGYELHAISLGEDPLNSYSLVFAGQHCFVNDRDPAFGQSLCDKALEINPSNAMGWAFRSNMLLLQGKTEEGAEAARRGLYLASGQPCRSSLQINACLSEIAAGRYQEAVTYGRMSQLSPAKSQAIRRFLFALFRALDMPVDADRQLSAIRMREPEFRPENMLSADYPTWTLQKMRIAESLSSNR